MLQQPDCIIHFGFGKGDLSNWTSGTKQVLLVQQSSASSEHINFSLKSYLEKDKIHNFKTYIETPLMLQY